MRYHHDYYTSKDHTLSVEFLFVNLSDTNNWRAYILSHINYGMRSSSHTEVHRLTESDIYMRELISDFKRDHPSPNMTLVRESSIEYVCWTAKVDSLDVMMSIASAWVDITAYYIRYGGSFPEIQQKLSREGVI